MNANKAKAMRQQKRRKRILGKLSTSTVPHRVLVSRSNRHFVAQLIDRETGNCLVTSTTYGKGFSPEGGTNSVESCKRLAQTFAEKVKAQKIEKVVFDRAGYQYHGKVKAFADGLREAGLKL